MRIAIVSDIHGNRTALEAVVADLGQTSPDLILHGGDLPQGGASPAEIVDRIRELGWQGVAGNTDEMLFRPESLTEFASQLPQLQSLWAAIEEMAVATREALGEERLTWLSALPRVQIHGSMALVHASLESLWRAPAPEASDDRVGIGLFAARTADGRLWAHSSGLHSQRFRPKWRRIDHRQHWQR